MNDKWLALACFSLASLADAKITDTLIGLGIAKEFNPVMAWAQDFGPSCMWLIKIAASLLLMVLIRKVSFHFLLALTAGMTLVLAWNCGLLAVWYFSNCFVS